jgi:hypothetical protein
MTTKYGYFDGANYTCFTNATSVKGAVRIAMKVHLRKEGKKLNQEDLQKCYDELGENLAEIMRNDGSEKRTMVMAIDEMVSYFTNPGWITTRKGNGIATCIDNSKHYSLVMEVCRELGVVEKEFEIYSADEWELIEHTKLNA